MDKPQKVGVVSFADGTKGWFPAQQISKKSSDNWQEKS